MKIIKHTAAICLCCILCGCATGGMLRKAEKQPLYLVFTPVTVPVDALTFPLQYEFIKSLSDVN
jgi:hypothetical protein